LFIQVAVSKYVLVDDHALALQVSLEKDDFFGVLSNFLGN
jgi:hypothetical protein